MIHELRAARWRLLKCSSEKLEVQHILCLGLSGYGPACLPACLPACTTADSLNCSDPGPCSLVLNPGPWRPKPWSLEPKPWSLEALNPGSWRP